jgi:hypothetical protein
MGLFSGWQQKKRDELKRVAAPYDRAQTEIWNREIARLGEDEFYRRMNAITDHQIGRTGPSGFEDWQRQLEAEITRLASTLAR